MKAIETQNLTRRFGNLVAVDSLDLSVEEGEVYGFLGPNGAGKTTTINMLLSLVHPTSGTATVLGHEVGTDVREIHSRIGVLPAHTDLYDRLTARKHLEFVIRVKDTDDDPEALLERVGIAEAQDRPAGDFSTGMAQRLKLAMALVGEPDLLILDEPTTGLDPNGAREMREILRAENDRGATIFFSSHIMGQVEAVCDRVGILDQGRLVAEDSIDALRRVAADAKLSVVVDGSTEGLSADLQTLQPVTDVVVEGSTVTISLADVDAKGVAMNKIAQTDLTILDFSVSEESLEDLFASYTGDSRPGERPPAGPGSGENAESGGSEAGPATGGATDAGVATGEEH